MIYLDNSATTRPFPEVVAAMAESMEFTFFNPAAAYGPAAENEKRIKGVAKCIADSLHAVDASVYFTSGGTESNNWALRGFLSEKKGLHTIITTEMEHPSVLDTAEQLEKEGWHMVVLPVDSAGQPDEVALAAALDAHTAVVSIMHVNNETGAMPDIVKLSSIVHRLAPQAVFHCDGVQGYLRCPMDMTVMGVDAYSVSAHKIHGPKGIGALILRKGLRIQPLLYGGGQQNNMRSGTENVPSVMGFGKAVELYREHAAQYRENLLHLRRTFLQALGERTDNWQCNAEAAPHIISLRVNGVQGQTLVHALEDRDVYLGVGSACSSSKKTASHALLAQGLSVDAAKSTVRVSLSPIMTEDDMVLAAEAVAEAAAYLRKFGRKNR